MFKNDESIFNYTFIGPLQVYELWDEHYNT